MNFFLKLGVAAAFLYVMRELARSRAAAHAGGMGASPHNLGDKQVGRIDEIQKLSTAMAAETDPAKKQAIAAERAKLATEELAAQKAAAMAPPKVTAKDAIAATLARGPVPPYPQGMVAKFGKREATILRAWQDGQGGWHFKIDLKSGEFLNLGSDVYDVNEATLREHLQKELGAMAPGQLYPSGIYVMNQGKGGVIERVERNGDQFQYHLRGWPQPVSQADLNVTLRG